MATLNTRRLLAGAMGISAVAFVLDRTVLSEGGLGPATAAAAIAEHSPVAPAERLNAPAAQSATAVLVQRLRELEKQEQLKPLDVADAFRLGAGIDPAAPAAGAVTSDERRISDFKANHQLNAVWRMAMGKDDPTVVDQRAVVDNRQLRIGDELDGFTLVEVMAEQRVEGSLAARPSSARFTSGKLTVELEVPTKMTVRPVTAAAPSGAGSDVPKH